jgi:hypothetical protein
MNNIILTSLDSIEATAFGFASIVTLQITFNQIERYACFKKTSVL